MSATLFFLEVFSILLAAAAGVLGTLTSFKEKRVDADGEREVVTSWGWLAIAGIGLATLIGITSHVLRSRREEQGAKAAAEAALEETKKLERIVHNLERSLRPLELRPVFFSVVVPFPEPKLEYSSKLKTAVDNFFENYEQYAGSRNTVGPSWQGISANATGLANGTGPANAIISPESPFYPKGTTPEGLLFRHTELVLLFFKTPVSASSLSQMERHPRPDLVIHLSSTNEWTLTFDYRRKELSLYDMVYPKDRKEWISNGELVSILDLAGAQLVIRMPNPKRLNPATDALTIPIYAKFSQPRLHLDFGTKEFRLEASQLEKHLHKEGAPFWVYHFPKDVR
jgi:hypothetical protein